MIIINIMMEMGDSDHTDGSHNRHFSKYIFTKSFYLLFAMTLAIPYSSDGRTW